VVLFVLMAMKRPSINYDECASYRQSLLPCCPPDIICVPHCFAEDDTSIATDVKVPILKAFHRHIYDRDWHFSCELIDFPCILFCSLVLFLIEYCSLNVKIYPVLILEAGVTIYKY